jgi:hypothetical protein
LETYAREGVRGLPYEIRVVFQSIDAYRSAVDRLYQAFGVDLPASLDLVSSNGSSPAARSLEDALGDDGPLGGGDDHYNFVVEDRTAPR